jgi:hypothetical protein
MNLNDRVISLTDGDLVWQFDGKPYFSIRTPSQGHGTTVFVDPFPCYSPDRELVVKMVEKVEKAFPIRFPTIYGLLPFEVESRTNGTAYQNHQYNSENESLKIGDAYPFEGVIVLSGKRIPIHPAMMRYLVAHEYGHVVDYWIQYKRGLGSDTTTDTEYAKMRGIDTNLKYYGGRTWHNAVGEVIANDFRIIVCGVESEFWPHECCVHPDKSPEAQKFWSDAVKEFSYQEVKP